MAATLGSNLGLYHSWALGGATTYIDTAYVEADGVHPNLTGYGLIGAYVDTNFTHPIRRTKDDSRNRTT